MARGSIRYREVGPPRQRGFVAAAVGAVLTVVFGNIAHAENAVSVGTYGADGTLVAVAPAGNANSSGGVAVSGTGTANGAVAGISVGTDATGGVLAASGIGNSSGGTAAVSGTGNTSEQTPYEASAKGVAIDYPIEIEGSLVRFAEGLLGSVPGPTGEICAFSIYIDLTQTPPGTDRCAGTLDANTTADGYECDACTGWNGLRWKTKGDKKDVSVFNNYNTSEETVDRQNSHGALLRARERYGHCEYDMDLSEQVWSGFSGDVNYQHDSPELASPYYSGYSRSWVAAAGHKWWDGGNYWVIENTETDICLWHNA